MANTVEAEKLLSDQRVVDEIKRHLWIESEKAGYDVGFEFAKQDWLEKFSKAWMSYHVSDALLKSKKASVLSESTATVREKTNRIKRRRAKSYLS